MGNREDGGRASRRDGYLSVEDRRDVIESPISEDLDVSGWELRKALRLLRKSNPPLLKWLKSPIVYRHDPVFAAEFGALAAEFYSPRAASRTTCTGRSGTGATTCGSPVRRPPLFPSAASAVARK